MKKELVSIIKQISDKKREKCLEEFEAELVRDSIFSILNNIDDCIVVYYPLIGEHNKAFHVSRQIKSETFHFVYINTAHDKEKQAFAAAHELGHIWKIDDIVIDKSSGKIDSTREDIINRFAAEFMMPSESFRKIATSRVMSKVNNNKILIKDMVEAAVYLMYYYFQPYSAVIKRFVELELISKKNGDRLEKYAKENPGIIKNLIITEQYTGIGKSDYSKSIKDIREIIKAAEQEECALDSQIKFLKDKFGLADEDKSSCEKDNEEIGYEL